MIYMELIGELGAIPLKVKGPHKGSLCQEEPGAGPTYEAVGCASLRSPETIHILIVTSDCLHCMENCSASKIHDQKLAKKRLRKTGNMLNSRLNQGKSRPRAGQSRYSPKTALCLPVLPPFPPESF